ncbi:ASF1 anti-silencing function 1 [Cymbomonas tetramitiformis]|uniref:ASF1 anti-silencing function 1 n=1 Tax=Cymbomonas tetramitiformis TaxID=36881 RepID=A0AAE0H0V0_9CHLO|nr:ASF1 anti-silencing function 1 [Cymbomonas tetramitiformis]
MSAVQVTSVNVLDNPSLFTNPLQFEIQYECVLPTLQEDLEWKLTYVGSAENEAFDQVLDSVLVGPVVAGSYRFVFQADPPDPAKIPAADIIGVTVLLLTCSYRNKEFIRVGYYVNNEYAEEELRENPPETPILAKIQRNILADKPRVTKFSIEFDQTASIPVAGLVDPAANAVQGNDHSMDGSISGEMLHSNEAAAPAQMYGMLAPGGMAGIPAGGVGGVPAGVIGGLPNGGLGGIAGPSFPMAAGMDMAMEC